MGRLEQIIARNKHPKRFGERLTVGIGLGLFVLLIIVLMVFTDLGLRPDDPARTAPAAGPPATGPAAGDHRVDDVKLYAPPAPRP